jgi:hypothetical protein
VADVSQKLEIGVVRLWDAHTLRLSSTVRGHTGGWWRTSGNLLVPDTAHAFLEAIRTVPIVIA